MSQYSVTRTQCCDMLYPNNPCCHPPSNVSEENVIYFPSFGLGISSCSVTMRPIIRSTFHVNSTLPILFCKTLLVHLVSCQARCLGLCIRPLSAQFASPTGNRYKTIQSCLRSHDVCIHFRQLWSVITRPSWHDIAYRTTTAFIIHCVYCGSILFHTTVGSPQWSKHAVRETIFN